MVTGKDGKSKYIVGIYPNGPNGKGPAFENINEAAGEVAAIIRDPEVQRIGVVRDVTFVEDDYGNGTVIGSLDDGFYPGVTSEFDGVTTSYILDPKFNPGKLPGWKMSNGKRNRPTPGELLGHELGHGRARVKHEADSNAASLRLENKVRTSVNRKSVTRKIH